MAVGFQKFNFFFWKYLTLWVIAGAISGCLLGVLFKGTNATDPVFMDIIATPGELFKRGLKCVLVPFIFCSMLCSVFKLKTIVNGNKIGGATFGFYLFTTVAASVLAVLVSLAIIVPGVKQMDASGLAPSTKTSGAGKAAAYQNFQSNCGHDSEFWCKIRGTMEYMVPSNIVDAMAGSQLLGVMSFGVLVGFLLEPKEDGSPPLIVGLADEVQNVMIKVMFILIAFTPFAVCSLLCSIVMKYDLGTVSAFIGWLLAAGFTSQLLQALLVYPLLYLALTRKNPIKYFYNIVPALSTAFATASSAATFPWTLQCATEGNKVDETVAKFVLPLGVTINMDGTCMTLIVSVFWLAYAQGLTVDFGKVILMIITAAVSSIGTAPIPSASLMYTGTIAEVANVPLGELFGVIVAVDWLRDRVRTCVNVAGDSFAVGIINHWCPMPDKKDEEAGADKSDRKDEEAGADKSEPQR